MASLSIEEENYVRMSLLLTGISPRAVRTCFDNEFAPVCLDASLKKEYNKLFDLKKKHIINQSQWNLLFPRFPDVPDSKTFDVTLMTTLLRNLTTMTPPLCGFDRFPSDMETTAAADLARIKHYRNYLAHLDDGKIDITVFNTTWNDISSAIERLGGQQMKKECVHMKIKPLDQANQEIMRDIKHSNDEIRELKESIQRMQQSHTEMIQSHELLQDNHAVLTKQMEEIKISQKDTIPWNIRAQHNREIQEWKNDETTFLETRATKHLLTSLHLNDVIIVTGCSGCGKSSNIHHGALYLHDKFGYEIIPVLTGPSDIIKYTNENKKQVFVEDDICGKESINLQTLHMWKDYSAKLEKIFKTVENYAENERDGKISELSCSKLLISCRLHIYKEAQFQLLKLLTKNECNLLSPELCLQPEERMIMMQKYLPGDIDVNDNVQNVSDHVDFFPLICKLSKGKSSEEVIKLLTAPVNSIRQNINHIVLTNKTQFCALVLCILFDDGFNTDWLTLKSTPDDKKCKLVKIVKEFEIDLSSEMARNTLKTGFSTLDETYFKRRGEEYRMTHDIIFKMAAIICGNHLSECFIRHASSVFIRDHFIFESNIEVSANDDLIILSKDQEDNYFERLLTDLKESITFSTFNNKQLLYSSFRKKLISFFGRRDDAKQLLLQFDKVDWERFIVKSNTKDVIWLTKNVTPLIESASCGYFDIVCFLIETVKCDVNQINCEGKSPLYMACKGGHTGVAKLLLQKNANVNKSNRHQEFSLFVACLEGHTDIVKLLIHKDADVNQCNSKGESPLYVTCRKGHTDIVKFLLQNKADVFQCNNSEETPLYAACKGGHIDTLTLLLQNEAEVCKCNNVENSPLFVACKDGHTETVKLLLQHNADVSRCNILGMSPLFVACARGHSDTVKLLLQHSSDGDMCNDVGGTLLYVACFGGHSDTVKLLLQNNTDVSYFNFIETFSLYIACEGSNMIYLNTLIKDLVIDSKCESRGETALYVACLGGHKDTVKALLDGKANVSKGTSSGISPLHAACRGGYQETVKLLLQFKADITQCNRDNESALYIACKEGHTSTAKLLLQNKAHIAQCNSKGESPLYVACKEGHTDTVKFLLQSYADVSQCEHLDGNSPLHVVCDSNSYLPRMPKTRFRKKSPNFLEIVKLLIAWKADVNMRNKKGDTPLDIARELEYHEFVSCLQEISS